MKLKFRNNSLHLCLIEPIWKENFTASLTTPRFDQVTPSKCSLSVCFFFKTHPSLAICSHSAFKFRSCCLSSLCFFSCGCVSVRCLLLIIFPGTRSADFALCGTDGLSQANPYFVRFWFPWLKPVVCHHFQKCRFLHNFHRYAHKSGQFRHRSWVGLMPIGERNPVSRICMKTTSGWWCVYVNTSIRPCSMPASPALGVKGWAGAFPSCLGGAGEVRPWAVFRSHLQPI